VSDLPCRDQAHTSCFEDKNTVGAMVFGSSGLLLPCCSSCWRTEGEFSADHAAAQHVPNAALPCRFRRNLVRQLRERLFRLCLRSQLPQLPPRVGQLPLAGQPPAYADCTSPLPCGATAFHAPKQATSHPCPHAMSGDPSEAAARPAGPHHQPEAVDCVPLSGMA